MAANPQLVTADCVITYDGVPQRIPRGTVIDVPAGSALATALGANITALTTQQKSSNGGSSLGACLLENLVGGGQEPNASGQN
jgi:hypothetical protein